MFSDCLNRTANRRLACKLLVPEIMILNDTVRIMAHKYFEIESWILEIALHDCGTLKGGK